MVLNYILVGCPWVQGLGLSTTATRPVGTKNDNFQQFGSEKTQRRSQYYILEAYWLTRPEPTLISGSLKQQPGRRQWKRWTMKSRCLKLYRAYSSSFNSSNVGKCFWSWILKDWIEVQKKTEGSRCLVSMSSTKREIRHFHVVLVQWQQRNVQKGGMHVQSCCFTNLNLLLLCR